MLEEELPEPLQVGVSNGKWPVGNTWSYSKLKMEKEDYLRKVLRTYALMMQNQVQQTI